MTKKELLKLLEDVPDDWELRFNFRYRTGLSRTEEEEEKDFEQLDKLEYSNRVELYFG